MNIAYDAKRAFQNRSGLGNYSRNLIRAAAEFHPEHKYHLFSPVQTSDLFDPGDFPVISKQGGISWFWRSFGLTAKLISGRFDIYHGLSNELPWNISRFKGKKIVTIHDVLFKRYPRYYPPVDRYIYDLKTHKACRDADRIVCISEYTKQDVMRFYNVAEDKIDVVHQQVGVEFLDHTDDPQAYSLYDLDKRYILYVGTIEERKDLLTLLKAFREIKDDEMLLYVVGGRREAYFKKVLAYIVEHDLYERVVFYEKVPSAILPMMYRHAYLMVYPSIYEGWGLPVAEAICSHVAVITTRNTSMEEAGGNACHYFNSGNAAELAEAINHFIHSEVSRQELINKTYTRASHFDPKTCSDNMNEVYLK